MKLYKYCHYEPCGKRFDRPEGISNHNWKISLYCCHDCRIKKNNTHESKLSRKPRVVKRARNYQEEQKRREGQVDQISRWQSFLCRPFNG